MPRNVPRFFSSVFRERGTVNLDRGSVYRNVNVVKGEKNPTSTTIFDKVSKE